MEEDLPHNAVVIKELLKSMGVEKYDPRVVHQLLNFMYRYVSDVLQDADTFARQEAGQKEIGLGDVMLAIQAREATSFVQPPSLDVLMEMAELENKKPLPEIPRRFGLRLPPVDECLLAPNYIFQPETQGTNRGAEMVTGQLKGPAAQGPSNQIAASKQKNVHSFKFLPRQQPGQAASSLPRPTPNLGAAGT